ncbi:MAG TPA: asparagine synthase (glutamine-hydrolyzing), partial [Minicystis sp.]|nr:asparagine synthase (glutamine-hydrolyzing) [Minicystis sp.]
MCGLAGFVERKPRAPDARKADLRAMGRQLARRGPDEETLHDDGTLAFVFRRLAIIDVAHGAQPIWNEDRTLFVAVNGEIYNHEELRARLAPRHVFRTRSDSEVVLHLFEELGERAFEELEGMFAVALWDAKRRVLTLARDRFGIKPLFYVDGPSGLLFGSELKALLAHPECPRMPRFADAAPALLGDVRAREIGPTFVHGVRELPGGHVVSYDAGRLSLRRFYRLEDAFADDDAPSRDAASFVDAYAELFVDVVGRHLMSDVPVGLFLSGGLDSAMIAAAAARKTKDLRCFHALLETVFASGDHDAARAVAAHAGFPLSPVLYDDGFADAIDVSLASFEYLVWMIDSPRFLLEAVVKHELHRYAKTVCPGLKVMLVGQGSDEFSGGYSNVNERGASTWQDYLGSIARAGSDLPRAFDAALDERRDPAADARVDWWRRERVVRLGVLQQYNLWHEDRTSSGQGVEARVPFLDHRLVEMLASVPPRLASELFLHKAIVRRAAGRLLPPAIANRPKMGYLAARRMDPIQRLELRVVERTLPAFLEKYTGTSDALFDADKLRAAHARARTGGRAGLDANHLLLAS